MEIRIRGQGRWGPTGFIICDALRYIVGMTIE
jgi:hypothetical protein